MEWIRRFASAEPRQIDVVDREDLRDGALRALPNHLLAGKEAMVQWERGKFAPAVILMTGTFSLCFGLWLFLFPPHPPKWFCFFTQGTREQMMEQQKLETAKAQAAEENMDNSTSGSK